VRFTAAVWNLRTCSANQNYLTDVGAFSGSGSFHGTFDQIGNVQQWNDLTGAAGSSRGVRGGGWIGTAFNLRSSYGPAQGPSHEGDAFGFRLAAPAAVREPSTYPIALAGLACGGYSMFCRRKWA
jgi:formylglycine-generating enzyme required for sulfatase activity